MSILVPFNGTGYLLPTNGESGWGAVVTAFFTDLGGNAITSIGAQTLTNKTIRLASGTAAAPSISFAADTASGVYQPSTNQLALSTNGTQRLVLDGSGNISLTGNTTNTGNLTVSGTTTASGLLVNAQVSNAVGRNIFHNGLFRVLQRGSGSWTGGAAYTTDRWLFSPGGGGGSRTLTAPSLTDANRAAIGDEEAATAMQYTLAGGAGAGDYDLLSQRVETVRRTANKTVTLSFWALCGSGTPKVGVGMYQYFGSGGSPSASVIVAAQAITLSTSWTRYSATFTIPSVSGKTFGTTPGSDFLEVDFWLSSGSTNNVQAGSIGVQSATVQFWGMQMEIGATVTPLDKPDIRHDLMNCQRFYQVGQLAFQGGYGTPASSSVYFSQPFPVQMRANATMTTATNNCSNVGSLSYVTLSPGGMGTTLIGVVTATGSYVLNTNYTASADL